MNLIPAAQSGTTISIGDHTLDVPPGLSGSGSMTLAVRPEDLALVSSATERRDVWKGQVEQVMDLGHYRKALVNVPGVGLLKAYLSKAMTFSEGETLALYPSRFLIYRDGQAPVEVRRQVGEGALTFNA
jgi:ABC-type sulfate/molybdate transport systems ATPase subunit